MVLFRPRLSDPIAILAAKMGRLVQLFEFDSVRAIVPLIQKDNAGFVCKPGLDSVRFDIPINHDEVDERLATASIA